MPDRLGQFYGIWPVIDGKPLQLQWGEIRQNQAETKAIVRNSIQQLEASVDSLNALRARLGDQYGNLDIQGRFRTIYVEADNEFCIQKNDGDDENPIWVDVLCIRQHDGQVQVVSEGGIVSSAGFYNFPREIHLVGDSHSLGTDTDEDVTVFNTDRILFDRDSGLKVRLIDCGEHSGSPEVTFTAPFGRSQIFHASGEEWVIEHNFGAGPQMVQVMDADDRVIIPDTVDVSDPNTAYFYFHDTVVGSVIIATGGLGAHELRPKDPFYLVVRTDTQPSDTRRLRPNANLIFDHKYFYVETHEDIVDGCPGANPRAFVTILPEIFYLNDLKDVTITERPDDDDILTYDAALGAWVPKTLGAVVSSVTVAQSNGVASFSGIQVINFEAANFYVTQNPGSLDEVQINFRGTASGGSSATNGTYVHSQGISAVEWIVNHSLNSELVIAQAYDSFDTIVYPDVIDASNPNVTYFYFTTAQAGKAMVISKNASGISAGVTDHGALTGLADDDHPQYVLATGTRNITGDFVMEQSLQVRDTLEVRNAATAEGFYVSKGPLGVGADLNTIWIPFHVETVAVDNYFLDWAGASYVVDDVEMTTESGECSLGFYLRNRIVVGRTKRAQPLPGVPIVGLHEMKAVFYLASGGTATANRVVSEGKRLVMSVFSNSSAIDLHGRVRGRRAG